MHDKSFVCGLISIICANTYTKIRLDSYIYFNIFKKYFVELKVYLKRRKK